MTTVGGTLGAPSNEEMVGLVCDDGVLEVARSVIDLALGRFHIHEESVGVIGGGGVAGLKVYRFGGPRRAFADLYGMTVPSEIPKPAVQPPPVPTPAVPQTPQIPASAQPWKECPYMGGVVTYEGRVIARMINDVGRAVNAQWR